MEAAGLADGAMGRGEEAREGWEEGQEGDEEDCGAGDLAGVQVAPGVATPLAQGEGGARELGDGVPGAEELGGEPGLPGRVRSPEGEVGGGVPPPSTGLGQGFGVHGGNREVGRRLGQTWVVSSTGRGGGLTAFRTDGAGGFVGAQGWTVAGDLGGEAQWEFRLAPAGLEASEVWAARGGWRHGRRKARSNRSRSPS